MSTEFKEVQINGFEASSQGPVYAFGNNFMNEQMPTREAVEPVANNLGPAAHESEARAEVLTIPERIRQVRQYDEMIRQSRQNEIDGRFAA